MKVYSEFFERRIEKDDVFPKYSKGDMVVVKGGESYNKINYETHTMEPTLLKDDEEGEVVKAAWAEGDHPHYVYWVELNSGGTILINDAFLHFPSETISTSKKEGESENEEEI